MRPDYKAYLISWRASVPRLRGALAVTTALLGGAALACSSLAVEANTASDSGGDSDTEDVSNASTSTDGQGGSTGTGGPGATGTTAATSSNTAELTDSSSGDDTTSAEPETDTNADTEGPDTSCDPYAQDCPEGEKCAPYSNNDELNWNDTKCVPLDADPAAPGESCMDIGAPFDGEDTCEAGAICWNVDEDTMTGVCEPLCGGTPEEPTCPEDYVCSVSGNSSVSLCLKPCDPLAGETACEGADEACLPAPGMPAFFCLELMDTLKAGFACDALNVCAPGLFCAPSDAVTGCDPDMSDGCCTPFCALDDPDCQALPGNECAPFFEQMVPGAENVGLCATP